MSNNKKPFLLVLPALILPLVSCSSLEPEDVVAFEPGMIQLSLSGSMSETQNYDAWGDKSGDPLESKTGDLRLGYFLGDSVELGVDAYGSLRDHSTWSDDETVSRYAGFARLWFREDQTTRFFAEGLYGLWNFDNNNGTESDGAFWGAGVGMAHFLTPSVAWELSYNIEDWGSDSDFSQFSRALGPNLSLGIYF